MDGNRFLVPIPKPIVEEREITGHVIEKEQQVIGCLVFDLFEDSDYDNLKVFMEDCNVQWQGAPRASASSLASPLSPS